MLRLVNLTDFEKPYKGKDGLWRPSSGVYAECHRLDATTGEVVTFLVAIKPKFDDNARDYYALTSEAVVETRGNKDKFIKDYPGNVYSAKQNKQNQKK